MTSDAELMKASLLAVAETGGDIREPLFERFFAEYPERRAAFIAFDASSMRMADETLQMMFGLANGEEWVWPLVAELVYEHRGYGDPEADEYTAFIDMAVEALGQAAGAQWNADAEAAWRRQAAALADLVTRAKDEWAAFSDRD